MICSPTNPVQISEDLVLVPLYDAAKPFAYSQINCDLSTETNFTPGEMVISVFLFWIFSLLIIALVLSRIYGIKVRQ